MEDIVPGHARLLRVGLKRVLAGKSVIDSEIDIAEETFMISAAVVTNDLGEVAGISVAYTNITTMKRLSRKLQETEQRTSYALESAGQWIWDLNIVTNRVWRSPQYRALLGLDPDGPERENVAWDIVHPDDKPKVLQAFEDVLSGRKSLYEAVYRVIRPDGGDTWILSRGKIVERAPDGAPLRLLATSVDITDQKRIEEHLTATVQQRLELEKKLVDANTKLKKLSERDYLTDLANRRKFNRVLKREFIRANDRNHTLVVVMIDIDHFKSYNDFYGHLAGDKCLVQVGRALSKVVNKIGGSLARFGGEEFAVLVSDVTTQEACAIGECLVEAVSAMKLEHPASPKGLISVSVGMAVLNGEDQTIIAGPDDLLNLADSALYESKRNGRARVSLWGFFGK